MRQMDLKRQSTSPPILPRSSRPLPVREIPFECLVPGKWILAGEHTVLRGGPALVFPLSSRRLRFSWAQGGLCRRNFTRQKTCVLTGRSHRDQNNPCQQNPGARLRVSFSGEFGLELEKIFWKVLDRACELTRVPLEGISGCVHIESDIPLGGGLGASAALCVAISQWFAARLTAFPVDVFSLACHLENLFHGESSGVDIAVVLCHQGLRFSRRFSEMEALKRQTRKEVDEVNEVDKRGGGIKMRRKIEKKIITPQWYPNLFLSYSGKRGITSFCVSHVKSLMEHYPDLGQAIDQKMTQAVEAAEAALSQPLSLKPVLMDLAGAIQSAQICFERWGLCEGEMSIHLRELKSSGALAVKPTGSGFGGYALSLWMETPSEELRKRFGLIECFDGT